MILKLIITIIHVVNVKMVILYKLGGKNKVQKQMKYRHVIKAEKQINIVIQKVINQMMEQFHVQNVWKVTI